MDTLGLRLLLIPVLIAANAFFVIAEYALVAVRPSQVELIRSRGGRMAAAALERLKGDMSSAIGAVQVCITMTNLLIGWIAEPAMSLVLGRALSPLGVILPAGVADAVAVASGFVIVTLLTVVLSELVPKAVTLQYTLILARLSAVPMLQIQRAITPLVWIMNGLANLTTRALGLGPVAIEDAPLTAEEIATVAGEAQEAGTLTARERSLILNSLALGRKRASQIMIPRVRVSHLDLQWSLEENLRVMNRYLYSRLPLCDGGMDRVVGLIYTKEFLIAYQEGGQDSAVLSLIARPAVFMPVSLPLDKLLPAFHENRTHLIFLVDEYGGVGGIVTLHDVVEELIGQVTEVGDELRPSAHAPPPELLEPGTAQIKGSRELAGSTPVHDLATRLGQPTWGAADGMATLAGLVERRLRRIPRTGDEVIVDGVSLRVVLSDGRTAQRVRVSPLEPGEQQTV